MKALFGAVTGSKKFCCLCLKDDIDNIITIEDEVHEDKLVTSEHSKIIDWLPKIVDKNIIDVVKLFGTICKPCSISALNCYKFLQSTKENYKKITETLDNLSILLQIGNENGNTVFIDFNSNKKYCVNKIYIKGQDITNDLMMLEKPNSNQNVKREIKKELYVYDKLYEHNICNKLSSDKDFKLHLKKKHSDEHKCIICNKYLNLTDLKSHKHVQESKFICTICGKVFFNKRALENHEYRHQATIVCPDCGRTYKSKDSFRIHIVNNICNNKSRAPPYNGKYICDYCSKRYTQKMSLRTHIQYEHLNYKAHECKYCKKKFWAPSRLNTHILKHTKEKNFRCSVCGGRFATKDTLLYHTRMHTGEKPYECEVCGEKFISASRRLMHHKKKHLKETFRCKICSLEYTSKYRLLKHVKLIHNDSNNIDVSNKLQMDNFKQDLNLEADDQYFEVYDGVELIVGMQ